MVETVDLEEVKKLASIVHKNLCEDYDIPEGQMQLVPFGMGNLLVVADTKRNRNLLFDFECEIVKLRNRNSNNSRSARSKPIRVKMTDKDITFLSDMFIGDDPK